MRAEPPQSAVSSVLRHAAVYRFDNSEDVSSFGAGLAWTVMLGSALLGGLSKWGTLQIDLGSHWWAAGFRSGGRPPNLPFLSGPFGCHFVA
ncbi:hypothetical protein SAMN05216338_107121 [Bradyrhizobium sp. Rc2d]|nr:hypothetical protein SAMN05216338_107121 [Bradyrhizobium sp. Rc2d]